jgi:hypothetical protein
MVAHLDAVTCLAVDPNGVFLLSGSKWDPFGCPFLSRVGDEEAWHLCRPRGSTGIESQQGGNPSVSVRSRGRMVGSAPDTAGGASVTLLSNPAQWVVWCPHYRCGTRAQKSCIVTVAQWV